MACIAPGTSHEASPARQSPSWLAKAWSGWYVGVSYAFRSMDQASPDSPRSTCRFKKSDGELCRRGVQSGEEMCWQHAKSWPHKWRSLTRNQSILFILAALGVFLTTAGLFAQLIENRNLLNKPRLRDVEVGVAENHPTTDQVTAVVKHPEQRPIQKSQSTSSGRVDWHDKRNWRANLRVGMTRTEVRELFGEPPKIDVVSELESWSYGSGSIEFIVDSASPDGQLHSWFEPD
jgi:hypothetical protein